jgi:hypothetical protein
MNATKSLVILIGVLAVLPAFADTSVTQRNITWTFSEDNQVGQYANGDYWVVGPVTITGISPGSVVVPTRTKVNSGGDVIGTASNTVINGSWVNPVAAMFGSQGFDSGMSNLGYSANLNAARPSGADLSPSNPLVLSPGSSLISSISHPHAGRRPQLTDAEILTVVAEPQPAGTMRPPYCGTDKTTWNVSDFNRNVLRELPALPNMPSLTSLETKFARPWIEIRTQSDGRYLHPSNNQPDYGREIANYTGDALLALHFRTHEENSTLLTRMVQYGIDIYGAAKTGGHWQANGGHNMGRKGPLLLAGIVLAEPDIMAYADKSLNFIFQEDQQTFVVGQSQVDYTYNNFTTRNVSAISVSGDTATVTIPSGQSWMEKQRVIYISGATPTQANGYWVIKNENPTSTSFKFHNPGSIPNGPVTGVAQIQYYSGWNPDYRSKPAPYTPAEIGVPEWGIRHRYDPSADNYAWSAIYRDVACPPMAGHALFARLLFQGRSVWNWQPFFDYYDRYVGIESGKPNSHLSTWVRDAWLVHRQEFESDDFEYANSSEAAAAGLTFTDSPTFNYTTAPAPLQGAASVYCSSSGNPFRTRAFETTGDSSFYFMWYPRAAPIDATIVALYDSANSPLGVSIVARHTGEIRIINGTTSTSNSVLFSPATLYHVWVEYSPHPTASTVRIFLSTTDIKPATPTYTKSNGTATGALGRVRFQGATGAGQIFDKFRASDAWDIGSAPE